MYERGTEFRRLCSRNRREVRKGMLLIGGDMNAKFGNRDKKVWIEEGEEESGDRKSKDKITNAESKAILKLIEKRGWRVMNGNKAGDEKAGKRSVIDYGVVN